MQPRAKEGRRACENERVAAKKRGPGGRRNGEEVTPSAYVCRREGERERDVTKEEMERERQIWRE